LEWDKAKGFMVVVFTFVLTLFANMKSIQHAPVDTFICLRSTSPLILAGLDYLFLGRELPSRRSFISLLGIMCGVLLYVNHDYKFSVQVGG
jgi:solute carrier family 35 protein